ncbi:MAG: hypothetical protein MI802_25080 [Desulfobacterales bacterium]|nr:hypothetical protein [Desulfobacterales bacterium]
MQESCSLTDAAREIGVGPNQILKIIEDHPEIFSGVDAGINLTDTHVSVASLQAFKQLYEDAYSFSDIAQRLGVSVKRIQKVKNTPGERFLARSFCAPQRCPKSGRPRARRKFPKTDAEDFIRYCEDRSIFKLMQSGVKVKAFNYASLNAEDILCASKAYRFKDAVTDGLDPQRYRSSEIEPGKYTGKLVFKVWGRRGVIQCFFILETDEFIRLSVFRPHATPWRGYTPRDGRIDFSEPGIEGTTYRIKTGLTDRGLVAFLSAKKMKNND